MLAEPGLEQQYPADAIERAQAITRQIQSVGAYSHSKGYRFIREHVARFIAERDGHGADPEHIFLTDGASEGIKRVLTCIISDATSGILLPIPQYPLYSAAVTLLGGAIVPYYLDEEAGWDLHVAELQQAVAQARAAGIAVKALCLINPGNPTGNVLAPETLQEVARFCDAEQIVILADEVYQANVMGGLAAVSMKKVVRDLGLAVELFSFHSTSKGFVGECGKRGGYFEACNVDEGVIDQLYKLASVSLCPNVDGQLLVDLLVSPPAEGAASHELYRSEVALVKASLERRAKKLTAALNRLEGVCCSEPAGAMYLFPRVRFPEAFLREAAALGRHPDDLYCLRMLEATGICVVPGSGFGQREGTFHFRMTFLPPEAHFDAFIAQLSTFHAQFMGSCE